MAERWVTADNRYIHVADLSTEHLRNIVTMIQRVARHGYQWHHSRRVVGKLVYFKRNRTAAIAGEWLVAKAQQQAEEVGVYQAARNLRKQGVPVEVAVLILASRSRYYPHALVELMKGAV